MPSTRWNASDYAKNSQGQMGWALSIIDRLELPMDARLVDLGCGDGKITVELARRVPNGHVVGIDNSPDMIELAESTWCSAIPNVKFHVADVQSFELPVIFDLAFSNSTLHWVPNHLSVLRSVSRALKSDGRAVFSMGGRGTASAVFNALGDFSRKGQWAEFLAGAEAPHYFFGPEEYSHWLPIAGLRATRVGLVEKLMRHENTRALEGWLRTTWMPYTERIPANQRELFLRELVEKVRSGCDTADKGAILLPMVNLEVEAVKTAV